MSGNITKLPPVRHDVICQNVPAFAGSRSRTIDRTRISPLAKRDGSRAKGIKREHGATYPSGRKAVAAPATVSDEPASFRHWAERPGKAKPASTREPGDLPSPDVKAEASGGVSWCGEAAFAGGITGSR